MLTLLEWSQTRDKFLNRLNEFISLRSLLIFLKFTFINKCYFIALRIYPDEFTYFLGIIRQHPYHDGYSAFSDTLPKPKF